GAELVRTALTQAAGDHTMVLVEHRVEESLPLVDRVVVLQPGGGVLADGAPGEIFARYGVWLADQGVWVPGQPVTPRRSAGPGGGPLLRANAVGYSHPGAGRPALSPLDFEIRAGEVVAVTGPNGSGKSTLAL